MLKSKFIDVLKTFSKDELKSFKDFVHSPYHNSNKNVIRFFEIIRKHHPEYSSPLLGKEKIFRKMFPGKKFNDTVIRILLSDLLKLSEEFLSIHKRTEDNSVDINTLLQELRNRGLDSLYRTNFKEAVDKTEGLANARDRFFSMFELEVINVEYYLRKDKQQQVADNLMSRSENLIYFMIIELIHNAQDIIINEKTFNVRYEYDLLMDFMGKMDLKGFMENLRKFRPEQYKILYLHYCLLEALTDEKNDMKYDTLREAYGSYNDSLSIDETCHFLHYLESCCLMRNKFNTAKFRQEIFFVYEQMLEKNAYAFQSETMTAQRFKNILIAAVNMGNIGWAEKFIAEYSPKVQSEYSESMYYYGNALLKFLKRDFEGSLSDLNKVKYDYIILKMDIKSWSLKNYVELGYIEQAESFIDSYRHFLNKNSMITPFMKERHLNFLKYTGDVLRKMNGKLVNPGDVKIEAEICENLLHKEWIMGKL